MSTLGQAVCTASLTILSGVLIFVFGQVFSRFVLDPVSQLRALIGEIAHDLVFYGSIYCNPSGRDEAVRECERALRQRASELLARVHAIPWYRVWARSNCVPNLDSIKFAYKGLLFLLVTVGIC